MSTGLQIFTLFHVLISLMGIGSGFIVAYGLVTSRPLAGWTSLFLITTVATSVTGYFFPVHHFMPSHAVGILSLILLSVAIFALYGRRLAGSWRWVYVVTAMLAQYLNVFVLIVQSFLKVPALHALAPTQTEPAFKLTQLTVLAAFAVLIISAGIRFRNVSSPVDAGSLKAA